MRSDSSSGAWTLYFGLQTWQGVALNTLTRNHGGIEVSGSSMTDRGWPRRRPRCWMRAARMLRPILSSTSFAGQMTDVLPEHDPFTHSYGRRSKSCRIACPTTSMLRRSRVPSPCHPTTSDGLCKQQTGVSFSATIRWERLVTAVGPPHRRSLRHRCRPPGRVCRRIARQQGVLGDDRGGAARLVCGATRFELVLTDPYKTLPGRLAHAWDMPAMSSFERAYCCSTVWRSSGCGDRA